MFSLHETTKIRLGRAAFVALCVVPTCAVLAWCVFVRTPAYRQWHERAITARLGWQATLGAVSSPRPGTRLYEQLVLSDRDTGQRLAQLPFVEIESGFRGVVVVRLPFPATIDGTRLDAFLHAAQELARAWPATRTLQFEARNVTLRLPGGDQSLTSMFGQLDVDGARSQAKLTFKRALAGSRAAEACLLTLTRRRASGPATATIQLTTGSTPLPTALLAALWPGVERLGKTCQFAGRISASEHSGVWTASLAGRLSGVDLDLLVSEQFPHKLSGLAEARLHSLTLRDGRIEQAAGSITAGPGVISRSLVQSAETHLHIQATDQAVTGPGNLIPYDQLCLGFEIAADGLAVRGAVPQSPGAILADCRRVLATEPPLVSQPVLDLVRTLVPKSEVHVPATRETAALTATLPVPSIVTAPGSEIPLPTARPVSVNPLRSGNTIRR